MRALGNSVAWAGTGEDADVLPLALMEAELQLLFGISKVARVNTVMGWIFCCHLAGSFNFLLSCLSSGAWFESEFKAGFVYSVSKCFPY